MVFKTTALNRSAISPATQILAYPHGVRGHGVLRVENGHSAAARLVARLLRLPEAGDAVETHLIVTPIAGGEQWRRTFGAHALDTRQYPAGGGMAERIGPLELSFLIDKANDGRVFRQTGASLVMGPLHVRMPRWCAPTVSAREDPAGEHRVRVDVRVELPLVGPVLSYAGTIDVDIGEQAPRREPRERSEPAERRARERAGESEGRRPSDQK